MTELIKAGAWFRVSTDHQEAANQEAGITQYVTHHGLLVVKRYELSDSAWNGGKPGSEYRRAIQQVLDDAHRGEWKFLVVWALDRITREGAEGALRLIRQLRERDSALVSVQETWLSGAPEVQDILVAFAGWRAQQESARRSERVKAGLARRRAEGGHVGRKPGAVDTKPRKKAGYYRSWELGGSRRRAESVSTAPEASAHP